MTTESKLGISMPAPYQCPVIDDFQKTLRGLADVLSQIETDTEQDLQLEMCQDFLEISCDTLESLREAITDTRDWGQEWKDLAKDLLEMYEPERLK